MVVQARCHIPVGNLEGLAHPKQDPLGEERGDGYAYKEAHARDVQPGHVKLPCRGDACRERRGFFLGYRVGYGATASGDGEVR